MGGLTMGRERGSAMWAWFFLFVKSYLHVVVSNVRRNEWRERERVDEVLG